MHGGRQASIWIWTARGRKKYAGNGLYFRLGEILTLDERLTEMWGARRCFHPGLWTPISSLQSDKVTLQLHGACDKGSQIPHPWKISKLCGYGTWGPGAVVALAVLGNIWAWIILKLFSSFNDSVMLKWPMWFWFPTQRLLVQEQNKRNLGKDMEAKGACRKRSFKWKTIDHG